jgi:inhibitor of KinA
VPLPQIHPYNEVSLLLQFPGQTLEKAHENVQHWYAYVKQLWIHWIIDLVPAYESLLIICKGPSDMQALYDEIADKAMDLEVENAIVEQETMVIPVCYDVALGNDLEAMAAYHKISMEKIIELHLQNVYHVYMLGFLPGFAYMGEVDTRIATPRKPSPVPTRAGAVGIAGKQTGIYPMNSPGGWHIVGYTPLKLFDVEQASPSLLQPGQMVKFSPIDIHTYYSIYKNNNGSS